MMMNLACFSLKPIVEVGIACINDYWNLLPVASDPLQLLKNLESALIQLEPVLIQNSTTYEV